MKTTMIQLVTRLDRYFFNEILTNYDSKAARMFAGMAQSLVFALLTFCDTEETPG